MIKNLWNRVSTTRPLTLGLALEGDRVSWLEVDPTQNKVINFGASSWNDFVATVPMRGRSARTVVQGRDTYYGFVEQDELDRAALDREIPFPKDTYQLRTSEVPSLRNPGRRAHFFAAARNSRIDDLRQQFTRQGMVLETVEVPATAMVREFVVNRGTCEHPVLLLHIGDEWTHLVIMQGGHPYLARDFPTGFKQFAYHWQMGKQCTEREAREAIRAGDVCQGGPLEPVISGFLAELVRSARSFPVPVRELYLSGYGVIPGLDNRLARETGLTTIVDDSKAVQWRKTVTESHRFKLPLGLAL